MYLKKELYELIRKDERIFDFIQESALDGLWYWDLDNPENEWMNAKFWMVLGYNPDEMPHKSKTWQGIINKDDLKLATDNFSKHCKNPNHPYDQVVRYLHKDGSTVWIRCRGLAIRDKNGMPIRMLGAHQDISDIKRHEYELEKAKEKAEESEKKYRAMYINSPLSYQSLDENGRFIDINPKWLKTLGYERDEVVGEWYGDFLHPDYVEHFSSNFSDFKKRGYVSDVQFRMRRKDNTYIYVSFEGSIGYTPEGEFEQTYCVFKDITEQKALEYALIKARKIAEENEEKYRQLFENMEQGFAVHEMIYNADNKPIDYRFLLINKAFEKLTGINAEKFINKTVKETLPNIEQIWIDNYGIVAQTGVALQFESYVEELQKYYSVIAYSPKKNYFAVVFTDVTKNKQYEQQLIAAKEKAEESDRLKSAFLANMSHEIRTPMNGILGFADLLKEPNLAEGQLQAYIDIIEKSGARMLNILNDIIDISSLEVGLIKPDMKKTNINAHIEYIFSFFKPEAEAKGIQLSCKNSLSTQEAIINTDPEKVYAILTNLVKNAIKYTPHGSIELGCSLITNSESGELEFYVKDTGVGITKDRQDAIFERFVQADILDKMAQEGAGLGLAITKAYVEMLGGKIWLESEEGKGSTFYFTLPCCAKPNCSC
ncbi:MAG: PAS domain S-box protein [Bacteroidales bacterium]|jgi:two-component system sensor histidine kinase/response regulator|nr:PAS domain S-box protein [Bacteroidales bacterium]